MTRRATVPTPVAIPRQVQLVRSLFPNAGWASSLVDLFNQFVFEAVDAFRATTPNEKELSIVTHASVAKAFPIDFPVETAPRGVWVIADDVGGTDAVTVKWTNILGNGNVPQVRVLRVTGLSVNSSYSIRLAYR